MKYGHACGRPQRRSSPLPFAEKVARSAGEGGFRRPIRDLEPGSWKSDKSPGVETRIERSMHGAWALFGRCAEKALRRMQPHPSQRRAQVMNRAAATTCVTSDLPTRMAPRINRRHRRERCR
jgi:poly-gamma-glutamate capsule biosynthesis protein CapA/YwtB (metallophosphatase superfamily)